MLKQLAIKTYANSEVCVNSFLTFAWHGLVISFALRPLSNRLVVKVFCRFFLKNDKDGKIYSLQNTDIPKEFVVSHHVDHYCTNVIQGDCLRTVCSSNALRSLLHKYCNQDGGSTGVSRPGGQDREEVARGTNSLDQMLLEARPQRRKHSGKAPEVENSWFRVGSGSIT